MAALTFEKITVEDISARAEQIQFKRFVLALIAGVLKLAGFVTAIWWAKVWQAVRWCAAAFLLGWESAHGPSKRTLLERRDAEIAGLKMQLSRFAG